MNWISINDALPDPEVDVLVYFPSHLEPRFEVKRLNKDGASWGPGAHGIGWSSHWQPLPAPPCGPIRVFVGSDSDTGYMEVHPERGEQERDEIRKEVVKRMFR